MMKTRTAILAAAALGAAVISAPTLAADSVGLRYADLDLTSEQGQAELERRIDTAARAACGLGDQRTGSRLASTKAKQCFEVAKAAAHKQVAERMSRTTQRGG